jgi:type II secretory pathway pseudopilin PulG
MRAGFLKRGQAFTLVEMMIAMATASLILAATIAASVSLQRSFSAVDNYFGAHMQQIRIVDYLARDVKRALNVTASPDGKTITINLPRYIIQPGDTDANYTNIGTSRRPTYSKTTDQINYGPAPTSNPTGVKYEIIGSSIVRSEDREGTGNWVQTTIASSADNLIPQSVDIELANTEYATTAVTFQPISVADRAGTIVYSTAYLRNRRR